MKVVGKKHVDYINKDGNKVTGTSFHFEYKDDNVEGLATMNAFVSTTKPTYDKCKAIPVGTEVTAVYNRYGRIEDLQVIK